MTNNSIIFKQITKKYYSYSKKMQESHFKVMQLKTLKMQIMKKSNLKIQSCVLSYKHCNRKRRITLNLYC